MHFTYLFYEFFLFMNIQKIKTEHNPACPFEMDMIIIKSRCHEKTPKIYNFCYPLSYILNNILV